MISLKSYLDNTKIWLSYPLGLSDITSALYLLIENVNVVIFYFLFSQGRNYADLPEMSE